MKVCGKVIIVTGAGNGIGRCITSELLKKGSSVAAIDVNEVALEETKKMAGVNEDRISLHTVNITEMSSIRRCMEKILGKHGVIDGIINCAGVIQPFSLFENTDIEMIERIMNINFYGTVNMVKTVLPYLTGRPEAHIVNISSMGGFFPVPGQSIYGASKAAVKMFTEGMYSELQNTKIRVTVIIPGGVRTNIIENSGSVRNEKMIKVQNVIILQTPEKVAKKILRSMESNKFRVFIGIDSQLLNLANKFFPKIAIRLATKVTSGILFGKK